MHGLMCRTHFDRHWALTTVSWRASLHQRLAFAALTGGLCRSSGGRGRSLHSKIWTGKHTASGEQTSVGVGHRIRGSKLKLTRSLSAAFLRAIRENGLLWLRPRQQLGLGTYESAWLLCAKRRRVMVAAERGPLAACPGVDGTAIPCRGKDNPLAGRQRQLTSPAADRWRSRYRARRTHQPHSPRRSCRWLHQQSARLADCRA